jgi:UPF0176 protein
LQPFRHLKGKIKKEIITMKNPAASPLKNRAPAISPHEFKTWLDEKRNIVILDTRNDYEVKFGTFDGAINMQIDRFSDLPSHLTHIEQDQPIVMFCTGGIRCEKAAIYMRQNGFSQTFQLDGGILGYFKQVGGEHYQGECFVFDDRIALNSDLTPTGAKQCKTCQGPIYPTDNLCSTCHH